MDALKKMSKSSWYFPYTNVSPHEISFTQALREKKYIIKYLRKEYETQRRNKTLKIDTRR